MPVRPRKTSRHRESVALGLGVTLLVAVAYLLGAGRQVELLALDHRFRHFGGAPATDEIVHVDIDDRSLEHMGRWPWPRQRLAGIIEVLQQCGARAVAIDIILPDPQEIRFASEADRLYAGPAGEMLGESSPQPVFDDLLLAEALEKYRNVSVPMHVVPAGHAGSDAPGGEDELLGRIRELVGKRPDITLNALLGEVFGGRDGSVSGDDREEAIRAYLRARSLEALKKWSVPADSITGFPAMSGRPVPPLVTFATRTARTGFVTYRSDEDGQLRRVPMLARCEKAVYPQFALALAAERLSWEHGGDFTLTADESGVKLQFADGFTRRVPVDDEGALRVNWIHRESPDDPPAHISAAAVGNIVLQRERIERNSRLIRLCQLRIASILGHSDMLEAFAEADELHQRRMEARRRRYLDELYRPGSETDAERRLLDAEEEVESKLDELGNQMRRELDEFYLAERPADPQGAAVYDELVALADTWDTAGRENERIAADIADQQRRLRSRIEGRIALVGSIATAAADFVPTPVGKLTPGVVVNSNVYNTIVSGAFVHDAPTWLNVAAIAVIGVLVTLAAAALHGAYAGVLSLILLVVYWQFNCRTVFARWDTWLALVAPLAAGVAGFSIVMAFRQLTEQRAKKHIRGLFSHALSPALVDRLIADPEMAKLGGERRMVTVLFSDLAGFTTVSERLGEQQTVRVLNTYFETMTEILQDRHGGYLNKFLGDGLLALFGAPVAQQDHAGRAIAAALDCRAALPELNRRLSEMVAEVSLSVRVGISTGDAMVGNCGSYQRMDYTAIGDCVNVASRLEGANKSFGTGLLVDGPTWHAGGDGLVARPLGRVRVVGKAEPVEVWHVLGADATEQTRKGIEDFAEGVRLFQQRDFKAAEVAFRAAAQKVGDDKACKLYLDLCSRYQSEPPGDDWDGAVELTAK
ncbi:MAG: CHASE2 domain-containing protein [Phycisphaerae bacterium]